MIDYEFTCLSLDKHILTFQFCYQISIIAIMSSKRGLGFNKFTGQRSAGLGYQQQEEVVPKSNRSGKNVSQSYSGGVSHAVTTYRDKMMQMSDQERIIEEKKKQIEAKLVAEQLQKAKESVTATAVKPALGTSKSLAHAAEKKKSATADSSKPKTNLLVNDGNFLERFKQMQQGTLGKTSTVGTSADKDKKEESSTSKKSSETKTSKDDSSKRWFQGASNARTWGSGDQTAKNKPQDRGKEDRDRWKEERNRERDLYHHESRVGINSVREPRPEPENPMQKQFRERWESQTGRSDRKDLYREERARDEERRREVQEFKREREREERRYRDRSRSPSPDRFVPDTGLGFPTTEALALEQAVQDQVSLLSQQVLNPIQLAAAQLGQPTLQIQTSQPQVIGLPGSQVQTVLVQQAPGELIQLQQMPGVQIQVSGQAQLQQMPAPPGSGPGPQLQQLQVIQQPVQQLQLQQPGAPQQLIASGPPIHVQQANLQVTHGQPPGPFPGHPTQTVQQIIVTLAQGMPPIPQSVPTQVQLQPHLAPSPQTHLQMPGAPTPPPASHVQIIAQPPPQMSIPPPPLSLAPPSVSMAQPLMSLAPPSMSVAPPMSIAPPLMSIAPPSMSGPPPVSMGAPPHMSQAPPPMSMGGPQMVISSSAGIFIQQSGHPTSIVHIQPPPTSVTYSDAPPHMVHQQQYTMPHPDVVNVAPPPQVIASPAQVIDVSLPPPGPNQQMVSVINQPSFLSQPPPNLSQAPPMCSQPPPFASQSPFTSQSTVIYTQGGPPMAHQTPPPQGPPPIQGPPPHILQPGMQFSALPPGMIKQEPTDNGEEYTTIMGEYGPLFVKKLDIKQEPGREYGPPLTKRTQVMNELSKGVKQEPSNQYDPFNDSVASESDYDPAIPTDGDSPAKEMKENKGVKMMMKKERKEEIMATNPLAEDTRVFPPENPETRELIDNLAMFVGRSGDAALNQLQEDHRKDPNFSFLFNKDSTDYKYFMFKIDVVRGLAKEPEEDPGSSKGQKRKRRSRWGPEGEKAPLQHVHTVTLQEFSRRMVGSDTINAEQLQQIREQREINMMYELILAQKKATEAALMAEVPGIKVKPKYEYDSDEETDEVGTWEHKNRTLEMEATKEWAEALTEAGRGKHHIGDFLPPDELERFMETFKALKEGRTPDFSDYKDFKLTCENIGYQMLQKLGWQEGEGLGSEGQGITAPVNKGNVSVDGRGIGIERPDGLSKEDDEFDAYRKRMMLAYRFRPNPLNNPRRPYY